MKKILSLLLVLVMLIACVGCANTNDTGDTNSTNPTGTSGESNNPTEPTGSGDEADKFHLDIVDVDMYGTINLQSQYVAAIAHNGNLSTSTHDFAKKTYVSIYNVGQVLGETTMLSDEWMKVTNSSNFLYNLALGSDTMAFYCIINNASFSDGDVSCSPIKEFQTINNKYMGVMESGVGTYLGYSDKDYVSRWSIVTDTWSADWYADTTKSIDLKVGETDRENMYISIMLNEAVTKDEAGTAAINNAIANNDFYNSIIILGSSDDLKSVEKTYGQTYNLDEVSFIQDILAQKISNMYGLALKDKDVYLHWDTTYITYRTVVDGTKYEVTFDYFPGVRKHDGYHDLDYTSMVLDYSIGYEDAKGFEYVDEAGNKYTYFVHPSEIIIFKNEKIIGVANTNQRDALDCIDKLFGLHK